MLSSSMVWPALAVGWIVLMPTLAICVGSFVVGRVTRMSFYTYASLGVVGVPLHELSHAAACLLFRMRITKIALFSPDPQSGRLGYVAFAYNPRSIYHAVGLLVQGVSPLLMAGSLLLWLFPAPHISFFRSLDILGGGWFEERIVEGLSLGLALTLGNLMTGIHGVAWAGAALLIGAYGIPSWSDVRLAIRGLLVLVLVLACALYLGTAAGSLVPRNLNADLASMCDQVSTACYETMSFLITCVTMVSVVGVLGVLLIQLVPVLAATLVKLTWQKLIRRDDVGQ